MTRGSARKRNCQDPWIGLCGLVPSEPSFRGTSGRSDTGWVSSPPKPGSETSETVLMRLPAGVGGYARRCAPPRIHRRGW